MGVDAMYAAGPKSEEPYKDIQHQERFSALPVLFDDGQGNTIWSTQRRYARACGWWNGAALNAAQAPRNNQDIEHLRPYVDVVENGPDSPATLERQGTDAMLLHARLDAGPEPPGAGDLGPGVAGVGGRTAPAGAQGSDGLHGGGPPDRATAPSGWNSPCRSKTAWVGG